MNENIYEEQIYNKHYVRLDANNNIIHGYSDAFLIENGGNEQILPGDICINEQGGRHFQLPGMSENQRLTDERGNPLYSYIDGEIVENPPYTPDPAAILEQQKQAAITQTKSWVAVELEKGMVYADGKTYNVTREKRADLAGVILVGKMNEEQGTPDNENILRWNVSGEVHEDWLYKDICALAYTMYLYVTPAIEKQQHAEIEINGAVNYEQIQAILQDFV